MQIHQVDHNFLSLRLQITPEGIEACRALYAQYRAAWQLMGRSPRDPLPQDWLVHVAAGSGALAVPEPEPEPPPRRRVAPQPRETAPAAKPNLLEQLRNGPKNRLLNYFHKDEEGVQAIPARLQKVAQTGKVQIKTRIDEKEKSIWVDPQQVELADTGPLQHRVPETVGNVKNFELG